MQRKTFVNMQYMFYIRNIVMDTKRVVGKRIKLARIERELNQFQLAELIGADQTYISKIEAGKVDIGIETLSRIAHALGKPEGDFFKDFEEVAAERPFGESPGARARKRKAA